jgi:ABC-type transport system substrate-binding protein
LRSLGYRVHLHLAPFASVTPAMFRGFQLSTGGDWPANYPDPSSYVPQFFGCGGGNSNGYYCNRELDRQMQQAELLGLSNPARANALWESVDRKITHDALWVPYVNEPQVDLVSKRLHNYEYNPCGGSSPTKAGSDNRRPRPSPVVCQIDPICVPQFRISDRLPAMQAGTRSVCGHGGHIA